MDKIFSARVDEAILLRIGDLAHQLHTTKKNIIEKAVEMYAAEVQKQKKSDVFQDTFGAWNRKERLSKTIENAREAFRSSMVRRQI